MTLRDRLRANLSGIRERIASAAARAGRDAGPIELVAVTKYVGLDEIRALVDLGVADLGENRVEAAFEKIEAIGHDVRWHMVGNIQRRKALDVARHFDAIDAVDRLKLAEALQRRCDELAVTRPVLLEVNVAGEAQKHGVGVDAVPQTLDAMAALDRLEVRGLMTMAPHGAHEAALRRTFSTLKRLADEHGLDTVSMGMTDDFEVAIEEGATQVRIGRALFV